MDGGALGVPPAASVYAGSDGGAEKAPEKGRKVLAAEIAEPFRTEIRETIRSKYPGKPPKLVGLLGNDDFGAKKYAEWTAKACAADGIAYELREVPKHQLEQALEEADVVCVLVKHRPFILAVAAVQAKARVVDAVGLLA